MDSISDRGRYGGVRWYGSRYGGVALALGFGVVLLRGKRNVPMNDNTEAGWKSPWWAWVIIIILFAGIPGGPYLAWMYDEPRWLWWTLIAVIAGLAG